VWGFGLSAGLLFGSADISIMIADIRHVSTSLSILSIFYSEEDYCQYRSQFNTFKQRKCGKIVLGNIA